MKLSEIATALNARLVGDGSIEIERPVNPIDAESGRDLALAMEAETVALLKGGPARAALVREEGQLPQGALDGYIVVGRSRYAMAQLLELFPRPPHSEPGIHPTALVDPSAVLAPDVRVGPFCYIGPRAEIKAGTIILAHVTVAADARIGRRCLVYPGARIGERVVIGERVIVHHNASLGADGFSFVTPEEGNVESAKALGEIRASTQDLVRVNSTGTVILADDVEIGACACIDRGTVSATRIGRNTKIDDLVMIGHNCVIGENCMLCGQVGIAGSTVVGDRVVLGGKVGVADHLRIGSDSVIGGGTMIGINVRPKSLLMGWPPQSPRDTFTTLLTIRRAKRIMSDVEALKRRVAALDGQKGDGGAVSVGAEDEASS
ncbi:MAG TPA: UDP-3-O-(3-hydroxymyristoyl)glucosamine N-acyltransferase [Alphaproteobacteria bacterium]|nr:UDP-3-O-(3-hydroxymyristoyl)glucosamine N-acyltransferase [Alphaproteobacteria bacterium]